ncbi:MAG: hydroxyisourate hydrolase [Bacteriovoracaceae bacterium]|jgi:hydroxyisourate hydrolase
MSAITTHILDTALGKPAVGVPVKLEIEKNGNFVHIGSGITNSDGRVADLLKDDHKLELGIYKISFATAKYYKDLNQKTFYPEASIVFNVEAIEHFHIPLLLSGFGYSTYRGS